MRIDIPIPPRIIADLSDGFNSDHHPPASGSTSDNKLTGSDDSSNSIVMRIGGSYKDCNRPKAKTIPNTNSIRDLIFRFQKGGDD